MTNPRWVHRPEGSNWGDFGPDDEKGRMNLLTPEVVLKGVAEVKEGLSFCLSMPLDMPGGNSVNPKRHRIRDERARNIHIYRHKVIHSTNPKTTNTHFNLIVGGTG